MADCPAELTSGSARGAPALSGPTPTGKVIRHVAGQCAFTDLEWAEGVNHDGVQGLDLDEAAVVRLDGSLQFPGVGAVNESRGMPRDGAFGDAVPVTSPGCRQRVEHQLVGV